jgi:homoserine O-acetyltransferase
MDRAPFVLLAVAVIGGTAISCRSSPNGGELSPSYRRAVLLDPDHAFWLTRAPDTVQVRFETSKGPFVLEAYRANGPIGVDRLYNQVRAGFFDDSRFYRVNPGYIVQFGIPGEPAIARQWRDRALPDDPIQTGSNVRGTFAYAMTGPHTRTTQLYINLADNLRNDGMGFTILGRVVEGMSVVDSLYSGYGETAGGGMRAGRQQRLFEEGNAHLDRDFPLLDRIIRATIVR